jgi:hypothetical protein
MSFDSSLENIFSMKVVWEKMYLLWNFLEILTGIYSKPRISCRRLTRQSSKSTLLKRSRIAVMIFPIKLPSLSHHS